MWPTIGALLVLLFHYLILWPKVNKVLGDFHLKTEQPSAALAAYERALGVWPRLWTINADAVLLQAQFFDCAAQCLLDVHREEARSAAPTDRVDERRR